jgi:HlyD family type I secretion membrane fusion protein
MHDELICDLADCTEFRQTLQCSPPSIVHGTAILLTALLATALVWSAVTQADLVVRAPGRVRPVASPLKVINDGAGEELTARFGGRVIEVNFNQGQRVRRGDVLIRLDTERLDNEITKRKRTIQAAEEELKRLDILEQSSAWQHATVEAKAEAELAQAREELAQAKKRQATDVQLAHLELKQAAFEETQLRKLLDNQLAAPNDLPKVTTRVREAEQKLKQSELPIDERKVEVFQQALALSERDYDVKRKGDEMQRGLKLGDLEAARIELVNLESEREQAIVRAPMNGIVTEGDVKVGDTIERGKIVLEIALQNGFRFEALVPSEEVGHLRVGMPARIRLDAYDYQRYGTVAGTVVFISPDSELPDKEPTARYVMRIELEREELGHGDLRGEVKLGMAGQVEVVTGQESILSLLVKRIRQTISLG